MSAGPQINYDDLAKQSGAIQSSQPDYDALAAQAGAVGSSSGVDYDKLAQQSGAVGSSNPISGSPAFQKAVEARMKQYGEPQAVAERHVRGELPQNVGASLRPETWADTANEAAHFVFGTNPKVSEQAYQNMEKPGLENHVVGGLEYLVSGVPFAGAPMAESMMESGKGKYKESAIHGAEAGVQAAFLPFAGEKIASGIVGDAADEFLPEAGQALRKGKQAVLDVSSSRAESVPVKQAVEDTAEARPENGQPPELTESDKRLARNVAALQKTVNVDDIQHPDDVAKVLDDATNTLESNPEARRTPIDFRQQQKLADSLGMRTQNLLSSPADQPFKAEELVAAKAVADASLTKTLNDLRNAEDPAYEQKFFEDLARHKEILDHIKARLGEAGRTLSAARNEPALDLRQKALEYIQNMSEDTRLALAKRLMDIAPEDTGALNRFVSELEPSTTIDKLHELWLNSLLTGGSPVKKGIGDFTMLLKSPIEKTLGGDPMGAWHSIQGWIAGLSDAVDRFSSTFRNETSIAHGEFETPRAKIKGSLGRLVRMPVRLLGATTDFFHVLNYSGSISEQSYKIAAKEGLTGDELVSRAADLAANPTDEMRKKAFEYAKTATFQEDLTGGGDIHKAIGEVAKAAQGSKYFRWLVPFAKTPMALAHENVRTSPLAVIELGGKLFRGEEIAPQEIGKLVLGSAAFFWAAHKADIGQISGEGPASKNERLALERTGWRPYSIKIGDHWVSYRYWEPIAPVLASAADYVEWAKNNPQANNSDKLISGIRSSVSAVTETLPFAGTLSDIGAALQNSHSTYRVIASEVGTVIPTGVSDIGHIIDPTVRQVNYDSIANAVKGRLESRIPGLSENVPALKTKTGQPIERDENALGGFNPFNWSDNASPKAQQIIQRSEDELSDWIHERMNDPVWQKLSPDEKAKALRKERSKISRERNKQLNRLGGAVLGGSSGSNLGGH